MRRFSVCSSVAALAFLTAQAAYAQLSPPPAAEGSSPSSSASTATASFNSASAARGHGLGIGAATMLNGTSGAMATWGTSGFHVDGLFGLHRYPVGNNSTTSFSLAARGWYHLHAASFADFSLGGGLGLVRWVSNPGSNQSDTHYDISLEVGSQIRAFIVPNVALTADIGLGMMFSDNDDILLGGQSIGGGGFVSGTMGIAYFFE
jgi:hypothetical protein